MSPDGRPDVSGVSVGELVNDLTSDVSRLIRQEMELARAELKADATRARRSAGLMGGAGLAGWLALLFLSLAAVFALAEVMEIGWAALIVGAVWAVVAFVMYLRGRASIREITGPKETIQTLKETREELR
jgi:hypothetical protein